MGQKVFDLMNILSFSIRAGPFDARGSSFTVTMHDCGTYRQETGDRHTLLSRDISLLMNYY
jgi:hypothetical protein